MAEEAELKKEEVEKSLPKIPYIKLTSFPTLHKIPSLLAHLDLYVNKPKLHGDFSLH